MVQNFMSKQQMTKQQVPPALLISFRLQVLYSCPAVNSSDEFGLVGRDRTSRRAAQWDRLRLRGKCLLHEHLTLESLNLQETPLHRLMRERRLMTSPSPQGGLGSARRRNRSHEDMRVVVACLCVHACVDRTRRRDDDSAVPISSGITPRIIDSK